MESKIFLNCPQKTLLFQLHSTVNLLQFVEKQIHVQKQQERNWQKSGKRNVEWKISLPYYITWCKTIIARSSHWTLRKVSFRTWTCNWVKMGHPRFFTQRFASKLEKFGKPVVKIVCGKFNTPSIITPFFSRIKNRLQNGVDRKLACVSFQKKAHN